MGETLVPSDEDFRDIDQTIECLIMRATQMFEGILDLGQDTARNAEQWAIHDTEEPENPSDLPDEAQHQELVEASGTDNDPQIERPAEERNATAMSILRRV